MRRWWWRWRAPLGTLFMVAIVYREHPDDLLDPFRDVVPSPELRIVDGALVVRGEPLPNARLVVHTDCRFLSVADLDASEGLGRALGLAATGAFVLAVVATVVLLGTPTSPGSQLGWCLAMLLLILAATANLVVRAVSALARSVARGLLEHHVDHVVARWIIGRLVRFETWLVVEENARPVARWRLDRRADLETLASLRARLPRPVATSPPLQV